MGFAYTVSNAMLMILAVLSIFSPFRTLPGFNAIWAMCFVVWVGATILLGRNLLFKTTLHRLMIFFFVFYTVLIAYLCGNGVIGNRFFELAQIFLFYIAFQVNKQLGKERQNMRTILWMLPFLIFTCVMTARACLRNPFAARSIKSGAEGLDLMAKGVGGYGLIYFLVISVAILLYLLNNKNVKKSVQWFVFFLVALFFVTIALSNFTTALLLTLISIGIRFLLPRMNLNQIALFSITLISGYLFFGLILEVVVDVALSILGDSLNGKRVVEINNLLTRNTTGDSMDARFKAYEKSLDMLAQYPFTGIIINPIERVGSGVKGFGQHSQIIDTFALFGLGIGFLQIYLILKPILSRIQLGTKKTSSLPFVILLNTSILLTINNLTPSIGFAMFFIFPVIHDYMQDKKPYLSKKKQLNKIINVPQ